MPVLFEEVLKKFVPPSSQRSSTETEGFDTERFFIEEDIQEEEDVDFSDRFQIEEDEDDVSFVKDFVEPTLEGAAKLTAVTFGTMALMPGAGIRAGAELLPHPSEDTVGIIEAARKGDFSKIPKLWEEADKRKLFELGSLQKATDVLEEILSFPQELLTTEEQEKAMENIGLAMKPFEMAAEGWRLIVTDIINPVIEKITGGKYKEIPYLEPTLTTSGEASAIFAFGGEAVGKFRASKAKIGQGLSAKRIEALRRIQEKKYGRYGVKPEELAAPTKAKPKPMSRTAESEFIQKQFEDRFIEEPFEEPVTVREPTTKEVLKYDEGTMYEKDRISFPKIKGFNANQLNMQIPLHEIPAVVRSMFKGVEKAVDLYRNKKIFNNTGFWLGSDGKWRYEIPDKNIKLDVDLLKRSIDYPVYLEQVYPHQEMYGAVPTMRSVRIVYKPRAQNPSWDPNRNLITIDTLGIESVRQVIHESQHAINTRTSRFEGSNVDYERFKEFEKRVMYIKEHTGDPVIFENMAEAKYSRGDSFFEQGLLEYMQENEPNLYLHAVEPFDAFKSYQLTTGELDSRLAAYRKNMSIRERRQEPPWESLERIVRDEGYSRSETDRIFGEQTDLLPYERRAVREEVTMAEEKPPTRAEELSSLIDKQEALKKEIDKLPSTSKERISKLREFKKLEEEIDLKETLLEWDEVVKERSEDVDWGLEIGEIISTKADPTNKLRIVERSWDEDYGIDKYRFESISGKTPERDFIGGHEFDDINLPEKRLSSLDAKREEIYLKKQGKRPITEEGIPITELSSETPRPKSQGPWPYKVGDKFRGPTSNKLHTVTHRAWDPDSRQAMYIVETPEGGVLAKTEKDMGTYKPIKDTKKVTTIYGGIPLSEITKVYSKVADKVWDVGIEQKLPRLLEKVPGGKAVNRVLIYGYRGDLKNSAKYISDMDTMHRSQQVGRSYALDLGNRLQSVSEKDQLRLGEFLRGEIEKLPKNLEGVGMEAKRSMLDLGKQAVNEGLLDEDVFFKNAGRYMPRLYTSMEYQGLLNKHGLVKPNRLDLSRFSKRKDIPKEIRQQMGEILTPGYPIAKGIMQLTHDIEMARWFNNIAANKDWAIPKKSVTPIPPDWKKLPTDKKLGKLSDAYVHPEILEDLTRAIEIMGKSEKYWNKTLGAWKFGKVVLSPKTHSRNLMSNSVLAHLGGFPMYEQPLFLSRGAKQMRGKGQYWKDATEDGLLGTSWTEHELSSLFSDVESQLSGIKAGSLPEKLGKIGIVWGKSKKVMKKASDLYQAEEEWFKLSKYIHNIERRGMDRKAASADAEKWLFNYRKIPKAQQKYRTKWYGAPFATFTMKALPRIAEAAVKTPHRFILPGAMIYGMERAAMSMIGDDPEQFKAKKRMRPDWMKGNFLGIPNFARVPIVDDSGRENYLNLTYILPWGDIAESGGQWGIPGGIMPLSQPFTKEAWQQLSNYDTFWKEPIVKEKDIEGKPLVEKKATAAKQRLGHAGRTFLPTPVLDIKKGIEAAKGRPDWKGRERPIGIVLADVLLGVKIYPVDYIDQLSRATSRLDPQKGYIARKIVQDISTLTLKMKAHEKKGRESQVESFQKQIDSKIDQLSGLSRELLKITENYRKIGKRKE